MRCLVVGTGSIGSRHCRNLLALGHDVLAWDMDARRLAEAAALGVRAVSSLDDGLARRPDAVLVCTPPADHLGVARRALGAGAHLFIEKPISHTSSGVSELIEEAGRQRRVLAVGFNLRHLPSLCRVRALLEEKRVVGRVLAVRAECGSYLPAWRPGRDYRDNYAVSAAAGGGVLLDAIHELDYLGWLFGDVERVFCASGHLSALAGDTEDIAQVTLRFESGVLGQVHLDYVQRVYRRNLQVIGEDGVITWDYPTHSVAVHGSEQAGVESIDDGNVNTMYLSEIRQFIQSVHEGGSTSADGRDGLRALSLVEAAKRSARDGGAWERP